MTGSRSQLRQGETTTSEELRVLLIEDMEDDAVLIIDTLKSKWRNIHWRRVDTESVLVEVVQENWDVVCSDFSMPGFNGSRALKVVRRYDPDIPFIFVSGTLGEEAAVEAMRAGAQDFITKGHLSKLVATISRELHGVRSRRERRLAEQTLRKLSMAINQTAESVCIINASGRIEYVNPAFEELTGYTLKEAKGNTTAILESGDRDNSHHRELWQTIAKGKVFSGVTINRRKDGKLFYEEKIVTPLKNYQGVITHFVSTGRDITGRIQSDQARERLVAVLEATPDIVAIFKPNGYLQYVNSAARKLLSIDKNENIEKREITEFLPRSMVEQIKIDILPAIYKNNVWRGETTLKVGDNREIPVSQIVLAHRDSDNNVEFLSVIARDISQRKQFEMELHHKATHDSLTDLPNRYFLIDRIRSVVERAKRHGGFIAMMFLDLDKFKRVNDSLGHAAGDILLKSVARRLAGSLRPNDTVARHGGDEFVIVVGDLAREDDALALLRKLRTAFERPVIVGSQEIYVSFSTGIALYPHDGEQIEELLRNADTAMYRAKSTGSSQYCFYTPEMNVRGHELLALEADLRQALERGEFQLLFQPQINLREGKITGVEALLRWQHPRQGLLLPVKFVPLLENSGLIINAGEWVLRESCRVHKTWRDAGLGETRIAVNVSAAQFNDGDLLDMVRTVITEEGMPPHKLELEITENIIMHDPENAAMILRELHTMGVRIAIDDFGTGYSSLAYLKRFMLNVLKIDRTFVNDITRDADDDVIVEASISLAQKLGLQVVAEGVETTAQMDFLHERGCNMAQGYYLSQPLEANQLFQLLQRDWAVRNSVQ